MWFLIYTKFREELRAKTNLENQGFRVFSPMVSYQANFEKTNSVIKPLFPRYIFIEINNLEKDITKINSSKGVSHLVIFGNNYSPVPNSVINYLKGKLGTNDILEQKITKQSYLRGDKIIVKKGLLKGKEATFLSKNGNERVRILLNLMSELIIAELPVNDLDFDKKIIEAIKL